MGKVNLCKSLREKLMLTQLEFAEFLQIRRSQLSKIELGSRHLNSETLAKIAVLASVVEGVPKKSSLKNAKPSRDAINTLIQLDHLIKTNPMKIILAENELLELEKKQKLAKKTLVRIKDANLSRYPEIDAASAGIFQSAVDRVLSLAEGKGAYDIIKLKLKIATMKTEVIEAKKIRRKLVKEPRTKG